MIGDGIYTAYTRVAIFQVEASSQNKRVGFEILKSSLSYFLPYKQTDERQTCSEKTRMPHTKLRNAK
jgi:hypothetical protein